MKGHNMKKLKGYTLFELVIVLAIIGIIATLTIPNMVSRVGKSKFDTANSQARSIYNSAQTVVQKYEILDRAIKGDPKKKLLYRDSAPDGEKYKHVIGNVPGITYTDAVGSELYNKITSMKTDMKNTSWIIVIDDYKVTHVFWAEDLNQTYVGVYCGNVLCSKRTDHTADYDHFKSSPRKNISEKYNDM